MKYESTIANNDANNDTNGFISIDIQLIAVEIHVAITPSVRVMAQYHLVLQTIRAALTCIPLPIPRGLSAHP